jgi:hypothetical protein
LLPFTSAIAETHPQETSSTHETSFLVPSLCVSF